jgi:hypothetical protein
LKPGSSKKKAEEKLRVIQRELTEVERGQDAMLQQMERMTVHPVAPDRKILESLEAEIRRFEAELQGEGGSEDPIRWLIGTENEMKCLERELDRLKGLGRA